MMRKTQAHGLVPVERAFMVFTMATRREPRQIDPKEVVTDRLKDSRVGDEGMLGDKKYHEAKTPDVVTWTQFLIT